MRYSWMFGGLRQAVVVGVILAVGCSETDKLRIIGDPCIKDDVCQSGRCDEQRCIKKVPLAVDEPCYHPLECRSKNCDFTSGGGHCTPGVRPPRDGCTDDQQCASGSCVDGVCGTAGDGGLSDSGPRDAEARDSGVVDARDTSAPDVDTSIPGTWVTIKAGTYMMGSPTDEACRGGNEDLHQVTLTRDFEIQSTEVTQGPFESLMGYNPSRWRCGPDCPVESLNWHEAAAYCNALSAEEGYRKCYACGGSGASVVCSEDGPYSGQRVYDCPGYRLPTEAEWEYAYRAGSQTAVYPSASQTGHLVYCDSPDGHAEAIAWYKGNSPNGTRLAAKKEPNNWGLYDMAGNVLEWCHDWYQESLGTQPVTDPWGIAGPSSRVLRGGSFFSYANCARAAYRSSDTPAVWNNIFGFRCARTISP